MPYCSKPPRQYGLPKIHKPEIPLRPTVSSIGSPCYAFAGKSESFIEELATFHTIIKNGSDTLVSFDIASLFINIPVKESLISHWGNAP
jgi:hypothetical protein